MKNIFAKKLCIFVSTLAFALSGCSSITTQDYAANTPKLDIRQYLNGPLEASGIIYDIHGKADIRFKVTMTGIWDGNLGTLEEHFTYDDGRKESRTWKIKFLDNNTFTATAGDVIGEAKGSQHGNAVNMKYVLSAQRASGEKITLTMDDWMYLLDETTLINRTSMHKFGIKVGELVITFRKL